MEIINRSIAPELKGIEKIKIIEAEKSLLDNGIPLYSIHAGTQDVIKIEFIFNAGDIYSSSKVISQAANHLIDDGTSTKTAQQIAEEFDSYGTTIECSCELHEASIAVYTLTKFLEPVLSLLSEVLEDAQYPESEVVNYALRNKQQLLVSNEKVSHLAQKIFRKKLFGNHAYGVTQEPSDFDLLDGNSIKDFYLNHYKNGSFKIIASGNTNEKTHSLLNTFFGNKIQTIMSSNGVEFPLISNENKGAKYFEKKESALQNAIRIGKKIVNRKHPDYKTLSILNTILGGYFGSRLMSNIREDKGYTYGIGSSVMSLPLSGYMSIGTEVGSDVCNMALIEIYKEIEKLRTEKVGSDELQLVKNYLLGNFLRSVDGPFGLADRLRILLQSDLTYQYYYDYIENIKNVTSDDILYMAQKYFKDESFIEVTAGN